MVEQVVHVIKEEDDQEEESVEEKVDKDNDVE